LHPFNVATCHGMSNLGFSSSSGADRQYDSLFSGKRQQAEMFYSLA